MSEQLYPPETYKKAIGAVALDDLEALEPIYLDDEANAKPCPFKDHNGVALFGVNAGEDLAVYPGRISDMAITDKIRFD